MVVLAIEVSDEALVADELLEEFVLVQVALASLIILLHYRLGLEAGTDAQINVLETRAKVLV